MTLRRSLAIKVNPPDMNIIESIGRTPLVELNKVTVGCGARVYLKSEFFNPLASVKDRAPP